MLAEIKSARTSTRTVPVLEFPETVAQLRPKKGQDFRILLVFASTRVAGTVLWDWPVIWHENSDKLC